MEENVIMQKGVEIKANRYKSQTNNDMTTVSSRSFTIEETQRYAGSRNGPLISKTFGITRIFSVSVSTAILEKKHTFTRPAG